MNASSHKTLFALCSTFLMSSALVAQSADANTPRPEGQPRAVLAAPMQPAPIEPAHATMSTAADQETIDLTVTRHSDNEGEFLGVILVSFEATTTRYIWNAPPLLTRHAVLAAGFAKTDFDYSLDRGRLPLGIDVHAQGVVFDSRGLMTSAVQSLADVAR